MKARQWQWRPQYYNLCDKAVAPGAVGHADLRCPPPAVETGVPHLAAAVALPSSLAP